MPFQHSRKVRFLCYGALFEQILVLENDSYPKQNRYADEAELEENCGRNLMSFAHHHEVDNCNNHNSFMA